MSTNPSNSTGLDSGIDAVPWSGMRVFIPDSDSAVLSDLPGNCQATLNSSPRLPASPAARKSIPMCTGLLDYFPDALAAVAECSKAGNDQHNPGQLLHWSRDKSSDHPDCLVRHLVDRGKLDTDGIRHSAKAAWRALAMLQLEIEASRTA